MGWRVLEPRSNALTYAVPHVINPGTVSPNPTDLQVGKTLLTPAAITGAPNVKSGNITIAEANVRFRRQHLTPSLVRGPLDKMRALAVTQISTAKFGASLGNVTGANF